MIVGSIHNQRIEHLWRDVFQGALKLYYGLFYHLESMGILDPNSDILSFAFITHTYPVSINMHLYVEGCMEHAPT